ncbi:MAG: metallophosphoesterase [Candidatus Aenigmatarchaeota archaeon]|nr:MAG: metallophosphoesterase [Candidatus Aenigmarchaeota archaeon]
MPLQFVTGKPALLLGKTLVIADLHLGVEYDFKKSGIKMPSQAGKLTESLDQLVKETKAQQLVVLGDIKHEVPGTSFQELREIPEFFRHFSDRMEVHVVLGNHDGGVERILPKSVNIRESVGFPAGEVYLSHGHTWPDPTFLTCKHIIAGHRHPVFEFRDRMGYRFIEQVWLRGDLDAATIEGKYKNVPGNLPEVILIPAFNPLIRGGHPLNKKEEESYKRYMGPLINSIKYDGARLYMLDGTYLGTLSEMKTGQS